MTVAEDCCGRSAPVSEETQAARGRPRKRNYDIDLRLAAAGRPRSVRLRAIDYEKYTFLNHMMVGIARNQRHAERLRKMAYRIRMVTLKRFRAIETDGHRALSGTSRF